MQKQVYSADEEKSAFLPLSLHFESECLKTAIALKKDKLKFLQGYLEVCENNNDFNERSKIHTINWSLWDIYETLDDQIQEVIDLIDTKCNIKRNECKLNTREENMGVLYNALQSMPLVKDD